MEAFYEFDAKGVFVRSFGGNMFTRAHGIKVDAQGNIWATDVGAHLVHKVDRTGKVLLTLGTKGEAGEWNEAAGSRKLNQPTDIAIAANGDVFVSQGHTPGANGDARVLKFDKDGQVPGAVGRQGQRARQVPGGARAGDRSAGQPVGGRPREPADPGVHADRRVRARDEVHRRAVQHRDRAAAARSWSTASRRRSSRWT